MQAERKESFERKLYWGFAESIPVAVNPDNDELKKIGWNIKDDAKEPEYFFEKEEEGKKIKGIRIDFYMKELGTGYLYKRPFFLENRDSVSKQGNYEYINCVGDGIGIKSGRFVASEDKLKDNFKFFISNKSKTDTTKVNKGSKKPRIAKVGESELQNFIRKWQDDMNFWSPNTDILLDMDKIFKGNVKELRNALATKETDPEGGYAKPVVDLLGVKVDPTGGDKNYQDVYRTSLPGYLIKLLKNILPTLSTEKIEEWRGEKDNQTRFLEDYEELIVTVTDPAYPWNREYILKPFTEFKPEESFAASGEEKSSDPASLDY